MLPRQSFFIIFSDVPSTAPLWTDKKIKEQTIDGTWTVTFDPTTGSPSSRIHMKTLSDWSKNSKSNIRYYSGTASYTNTLKVNGINKKNRYHISFDTIGSVAEVIINGQYAGTVWCSPWSLDITSYLKKGKNRLEIKVANNLWNRLVGMASGASNGDLTRQTHPLATEDSNLTPSGLLGKVRISVYR